MTSDLTLCTLESAWINCTELRSLFCPSQLPGTKHQAAPRAVTRTGCGARSTNHAQFSCTQPADVVAAQGVHAAHHHETDVYVCGARCIPRETGPAPARPRVCGAPGPHGEGLRSRRKRVKKGGGGRVAGTRPWPKRRQNGAKPAAPGPAGDRAARRLPVVIVGAPSKVPFLFAVKHFVDSESRP